MAAQRSRNTGCEIALRKLLHSQGLRFYVHRRPMRNLRREADLVFPTRRVAVFVDGCFWHGCPEHATWPRTNAAWWREKIERNRDRDCETTRLLTENGWQVVRVWEHDDLSIQADVIIHAVRGDAP